MTSSKPAEWANVEGRHQSGRQTAEPNKVVAETERHQAMGRDFLKGGGTNGLGDPVGAWNHKSSQA